MEIKYKIGAIEAVLFASGEPVEIKRLAETVQTDVPTTVSLVKLLNERYEDCESGVRVKRLGNSFQMCTSYRYAQQVRTALDRHRNTPLSNASMEVLTIIAYNQPVSKGFIENIRGTDSSSVVNNLVEKGLVEEAGRLDVVGKPLAYRTTPTFLRCFGLSSIDDLPPLSEKSAVDGDLTEKW